MSKQQIIHNFTRVSHTHTHTNMFGFPNIHEQKITDMILVCVSEKSVNNNMNTKPLHTVL